MTTNEELLTKAEKYLAKDAQEADNTEDANACAVMSIAASLLVIARNMQPQMSGPTEEEDEWQCLHKPAEVKPAPEAHVFEVGDEVTLHTKTHHNHRGVILQVDNSDLPYLAQVIGGDIEWCYADELTLLPKGGTK